MDPVQSWLDAKEVRRMAESLMMPAPEVDVSVADAGYGDDFEGFAGANAVALEANTRFEPTHQGVATGEDGRPHVQHQPVHLSNVPSHTGEPVQTTGYDESQRAVVGNALADARKLAEESGMLHQEQQTQQGPAAAVTPQVTSPTPPTPVVHDPQHDSPFKVSADQHQSHTDPVARQISPAVSAPDHLTGFSESGAAPELTEPAGPQSAPSQAQTRESSTFQPDIESPPQISGIVRGAARGPFLSRLQQFSEILRRELDAQAMFLIDNEGQVLLDEVENAKLIQVARTLANASYRASRQTAGVASVGNLHVKIGARSTLEVVPVDSRYGLLILGVIFPAPLGAERVMQVAELLHKTVDPHSQQ